MSSDAADAGEGVSEHSLALDKSVPAEDILESRIAQIEKKIFGLDGPPAEEKLPETCIVESLAHANTLISSALSGREKINALIQRLPELESYTETDTEPSDYLPLDVKLEYIQSMAPKVRENIQQINQLKELLPVLESDQSKEIPQLSEKLHKMSVKYINLGEEAETLNAEISGTITKYNQLITNISKTLIGLDAEITKAEKAAEAKKVDE